MPRADKAVLQLTIGLGVAVLVAYGLALPMPFVTCVMTVVMLAKPGAPLPLAKGVAFALLFVLLIAAGMLMVPLLENYAAAGLLLTAAMLYSVFYAGVRSANPLSMVLVISFAVMPVFILALTNPSLYLAAILKTVTLAQQAGETDTRSGGHELVGSTLIGALIGACVWMGLSLHPNLWMLALWLMAAALSTAAAMYRVIPTRFRPSFWSNALITALILLGPAIEDSAGGKSVLEASAVRTALFLVVALYAWATVWALEKWRARRDATVLSKLGHSAAEADALSD